jgi:hypothetical protein
MSYLRNKKMRMRKEAKKKGDWSKVIRERDKKTPQRK